MMPHWLRFDASVSGVQAPVLFRLPILRWILLALGCCVPATKAGLSRLMRQRTTFGIIPGGSEEVALHASGREHLYLRHRAGFVKYALRHGYTLVIAFSFGESDLYRSLSLLRPLNLWLVRRCGIVLPIFYGHWCCPLLPRTDVPLNTVLGKALVLPRIEEPTKEDVARWHAAYVAALEALYEEHKEYFGYAGRQLKIY
jgi:1-acyl-sn-glycerol-3-phosphate acyltransferase